MPARDQQPLPELSDLQLAILSALWRRGPSTINALLDELEPRVGCSRKTLATLLTRLVRRGVVKQGAVGREAIYAANVKRRTVVAKRMLQLLGALFEADAEPATASALSRGEVRAGDVARLKALLRRAERSVVSDDDEDGR